MSDFGTLKARIADELSRDDLTSQINSHVLDAIKRLENEAFWFNQEEATLNTAQGDRLYALPGDFLRINALKATYQDADWLIVPRSLAWQYRHSDIQGQPKTYVIHRESFTLYPTPDRAYTLTLGYLKRLTALSADTDSNAWTVEAEEMVRSAACETLCRGILRDPQWAEQWRGLRMDAQRTLRNRTALATTTGTLQPSGF